MFSGYMIPFAEGKSLLVGMLMVDRPNRCPENYIQDLKETFGEAMIGPVPLNRNRGQFTQMRIEDQHSLERVRKGLYGPNMEETRDVLDLAVKGGFLPETSLTAGCCFTSKRGFELKGKPTGSHAGDLPNKERYSSQRLRTE
jgi:hypothetical protein